MRCLQLYIFLALFMTSAAQEPSQELSSLLFWTAQDWPCEFMKVEVFNTDTLIMAKGKLKEKFVQNRLPVCTDDKVLRIENLQPGFYFFVAECLKEECYVCHGEGSYWQPIIQDKSMKQTGIKSKANIEGVYKTCHVCEGDGASSRTVWTDTLSLKSQQCRSVLLK